MITARISQDFPELQDLIRGQNGEILATASSHQADVLINCLISQDSRLFRAFFNKLKAKFIQRGGVLKMQDEEKVVETPETEGDVEETSNGESSEETPEGAKPDEGEGGEPMADAE